ncbi:MAG: hypothetical protein DRP47_11925 [Candidatus Zixiibacteriota bacterium]|nr:MAG: hypothetical protein DRP47_11925 [candidate division Zixibacteria bacterium]
MRLLNDIKALIQGLGIAGKHLGRHAITIQYPEEKWEMPERSRGIAVLLSDKETGELNCTACQLCEKACPSAAIKINAPRNPETKKKELKSFDVDFGLCCFCGLCEESCNFAAIKTIPKYEFSTDDKSDLTWDMKKLQEMGRNIDYTPKPKKKPAAKSTGGSTTEESKVASTEDKSTKQEPIADKPAEQKMPNDKTQASPDKPAEGNEEDKTS